VWETAAAPFVRMLAAPSLVEAAVRVGRPELAEAVAAAYADLGPSEALVARCRALVDRSDACYERALALERGSASRFERARTQLLYGEALRRARRRREARAQLHAAHEMFEKLGAEAWARRAAGELRGSGASANRGDTSRFAELTSQERQVARLVAAGATNKEVAAQLFLSPRTIDFHLRNVFAKLGITSRMQLGWFDLGADGTGDSAGATLRRAA
jgi:DNA-binding CsgD family transcriptional regulator